MKHRVDEMEGDLLDQAVCVSLGWKPDRFRVTGGGVEVLEVVRPIGPKEEWVPYRPSLDWAHGGPIIERERLALSPTMVGARWIAMPPSNHIPTSFSSGDTPLIAAMRAFVESKFGDEVELC